MALGRSIASALLATAAAGVAIPGVGAGAPATRGATLLVNDLRAIGTVGDAYLSLDEAIRLANGTLRVEALGNAERQQVTGNPGPGSADLIQVVLGDGAVIAAPRHFKGLDLTGNDGDILDGGGATLDAAGAGSGLNVASSGLTLRNLGIEGASEAVVINFGSKALDNISLQHLHIHYAFPEAMNIQAWSSNGSLRHLSITDCKLEGPVVLGAHGFVMTAGEALHDTVVEDVLVARNEFSGPKATLHVSGAGYSPTTTLSRNITRNVRVIDNSFRDLDDAIVIAGAQGLQGQGAVDSGIDGISVAGNEIVAKSRGIAVLAGQGWRGSVIRRGFVRNLVIDHNQVSGTPGSTAPCLGLTGGEANLDSVVADNFVDNVRITDNHFSNCGAGGLVLSGVVGSAFPWGIGALAARNSIGHVLIARNTVDHAPVGIDVRGGFAGTGAVVHGGVVSEIEVLDNTLIGNGIALRLAGGEAAPAGVAGGNATRSVVLDGNLIRESRHACVATASPGLMAVANRLDARCP